MALQGLNGILRKLTEKGKSYLPNPAPGLKLVFKKEAFDVIMASKGWKTHAEAAKAIGITRAYVSMMAKRRVSVSHNVILRLAYLMGNIRANWWIFYEIVDAGVPVALNHPTWNQEKYQGRIPYVKRSISADFRGLDYEAETL